MKRWRDNIACRLRRPAFIDRRQRTKLPPHDPAFPIYLVINAYSARNAGDAAIVLATASVLRANNANAVVRSATRYFAQDRAYYVSHDIETVPSVVPFAPRARNHPDRCRAVAFVAGAISAFGVVALSTRAPSCARRIAEYLRLDGVVELLAADRVIVCGGGYLFSARGSVNLTLAHAAVSMKLAQLAKKRPLMMPQSIGPLSRRGDRALVRWALSNIRPIVVRDNLALAEARQVMPSKCEDIQVCPDIAFFDWEPSCLATHPRTEKPRIGMVAMDWTWASSGHREGELDAYVAKLAAVARGLASRGFTVRLYGFSRLPEMDQDDFIIANRIAGAANHPDVEVASTATTCEVTSLRDLFGSLAVVIGTRMHSCIVAMVAGTPAVGLSYQPKSLGTFRLLGLGQYCFDVDTFDVYRVEQLAAELVEDREGQRAVVVSRVAETQHRIQAFYAVHLSRDDRQ